MKKWAIVLSLGAVLFSEISGQAQIIYANDDVFVDSDNTSFTNAYNGFVQSSQIVFGLGAANGVASGRRRSYIEFTLGTDAVASASFMIYNYWGANMGGTNGNPAANGSLRLRATAAGSPLAITEPTLTLDNAWAIPNETNFTSTITTIQVTNVGWYSIDVTAWYNARLGQTTTLQLRGAATSGFDFPLYEDSENSAYLNGSANTIADAGPRLLVVVPEPATTGLVGISALCLFLRRRMT